VLQREVARFEGDHLAAEPDARWPLLMVARLKEAQARLGLAPQVTGRLGGAPRLPNQRRRSLRHQVDWRPEAFPRPPRRLTQAPPPPARGAPRVGASNPAPRPPRRAPPRPAGLDRRGPPGRGAGRLPPAGRAGPHAAGLLPGRRRGARVCGRAGARHGVTGLRRGGAARSRRACPCATAGRRCCSTPRSALVVPSAQVGVRGLLRRDSGAHTRAHPPVLTTHCGHL
jgi:hypothetical protein